MQVSIFALFLVVLGIPGAATVEDSCEAEVLLQARSDKLGDTFEERNDAAVLTPTSTNFAMPVDGDDRLEGDDEELEESEAEASLAEAFKAYDTDGSGTLDAEELHHGLFDGEKVKNNKNISVKEAALSLSKAKHLISVYDTDNSTDICLDEFMAALVSRHETQHEHEGEGALLQQDGAVGEQALLGRRARVMSMSKCVVQVAEKIWDAAGCVTQSRHKECHVTWRFWDMIENCIWKTITNVVGCLVETISEIGATFAQCFQMVIDEVKRLASAAGKAFMDLLPPGCNSPSNCLDELLKGPQKLLDLIGEEVEKAARSVMGDVMDGVNQVVNLYNQIDTVTRDVGRVAIDAAESVVDFVSNSFKQIEKHAANLEDICMPQGTGFWYIQPTDCGAFNQLKKTIDEIWAVWKIHENFGKTVEKFGQCIIKLGLLSLPSPFMDIRVNSFCLPQWLQAPIKGVVGTFQYFIAQIKAVASGCSGQGAEEPVCQLAVDIANIGKKLQKIFSPNALLLEGASEIGAVMRGHSGSSTNMTDRRAEDFKIFIEIGMGITFPDPDGGLYGLKVAFEGSSGLKKGEPFFDLCLNFGATNSILGKGEAIEVAPVVALGFEIATPSDKVFSGVALFKFGVGISLTPFGIPIKGTFKLGFKILPQIDYPKGFVISAKINPQAVFQQEQNAMAQGVQEAVDQIQGNEAKVLGAITGLTKVLVKTDLAALVQETVPNPQMLLQHGAAAANKANEMLLLGDEEHVDAIVPKLIAGIKLRFCLTCLPGCKEAAGKQPESPRRRRTYSGKGKGYRRSYSPRRRYSSYRSGRSHYKGGKR